MLSSASNTTKTRADKWSTSCCVSAKKEASHVSRLREVLECAFVAAALATSVVFWFSQVGRGADVSTAPGDKIGPCQSFIVERQKKNELSSYLERLDKSCWECVWVLGVIFEGVQFLVAQSRCFLREWKHFLGGLSFFSLDGELSFFLRERVDRFFVFFRRCLFLCFREFSFFLRGLSWFFVFLKELIVPSIELPFLVELSFAWQR